MPDTRRDIGLQIMSRFHYRRTVKFITCKTLDEAASLLSDVSDDRPYGIARYMRNMTDPHVFTLGIEEEFQIVDPETRELRSHIQQILEDGKMMLKEQVKPEMHQSVVELGTEICSDITVRARAGRAVADRAGEARRPARFVDRFGGHASLFALDGLN